MLNTIDLETFSEADLKKTGAHVYSKHPSTEVLCLAYNLGGETKLWVPHDFIIPELAHSTYPIDLMEAVESGELFEAHNVGFEFAIWNNLLVPRYGFPKLTLDQLECSAAKAAAMSLPRSLEGVGEALNLDVQKDKEGHRIMMKLSKPRKPTKNNKDTRWREPDDYRKLFAYCIRDVDTEKAASKLLPPLTETERQVWLLDQITNTRGIKCDVESVNILLEFIKQYTQELTEELPKITDGEINTSGQVAKIIEWCNDRGARLESLSADEVRKALKREYLDADVLRVLKIRQFLSKSSIKKFPTMLRMVDKDDNRIRGTMVYHGAHTGRYASKGVQLQNLPRGGKLDIELCMEVLGEKDYEWFSAFYPEVIDTASSLIRSMLTSDDGKDFLCADFAAIEARGILWLCDDQNSLDAFRSGKDLYVEMAASIYEKPAKDITKDERALGKVAILGCSYGMGREKFYDTCISWGVVVEKDLAFKAVDMYRSKFAKVKAFWYEIERAAIAAVKHGGVHPCAGGKVKWKVNNGFLFCRLPSGRKVSYPQPRVEKVESPFGMKDQLSYMGVDSQTRKWKRHKTYGGKLAENCFAADTLVVTSKGLKRIIDIRPEDKIWDGVEWVQCDGPIDKGISGVGKWLGIRVTADHKIHDGNSWRNVIDLGEKCTQEALKMGQSSVNLKLSLRVLVMTLLQFAYVLFVVKPYQFLREVYSGDMLNRAEYVASKIENNLKTFIEILSQTRNYYQYGDTGTQVLYPGAITNPAGHIKTMVNAGSKCTNRGEKIVVSSYGMLKPYLTGIIKVLKLTASTMIKGMFRAISDWYLVKSMRTIKETLKTCRIRMSRYLSKTFIKHIVRAGKVKTQYTTISKKGEAQKRSWQSIKAQERVYDLLDCGPRHRFMIMTNAGPVIAHNCTQALCRDLMAEAMLRLEGAGYPVILTVHDEVISEVDEDFGTIEEFENIMSEVPEWAEGFPVESEGWRGKRYKK